MTVSAVLLDALGTLVWLEPPAEKLRASLRERTGVDVGAEAADRGVAAEIAYYMANQMRGGTEEGLGELRDDCARELARALGRDDLPFEAVRDAMLDSLRFAPFDDVVPALEALRERGLTIVVVSNWDRSLPEAMAEAGLGAYIDHTISSAEVGFAKPDPAPLLAGLEAAGVSAAEAVFVGDSPDSDLPAATAAGVRGILVDRSGAAPEGVETIDSLERLPSLF